MNIDDDKMKRLSNLASISLNEKEILEYKNEIQQMLDFVEVIDEVNTEGVEACYRMTDAINIFNEDKVNKEISTEELLNNAKYKENNMFEIPKVLD